MISFTEKNMMMFKKRGEHVKDCGSLKHVAKGWWRSAWFFIEVVNADAIGRSRGRLRWFRFGCNSIDCKAEMIVREDGVLEKLPKT